MADDQNKPEAYTVTKISKRTWMSLGYRYPTYWAVEYLNYLGKEGYTVVEGVDELAAYKEGLKRLRRLKSRADKRREQATKQEGATTNVRSG